MVRLTGRQAVNYQGVQASSPPDFSVHNRIPTTTDWQNFYLGDLWLVNNRTIPQDQFVYILVSLRNNIANWVRFAGGTGNLTSLTSNTGGTVFGDAAQNINTIGDGTTITGVGNPGTNTITFSVVGGRAAQSFVASAVTTPTGLGGTAAPILGVINVQSNHNLNVSAGLPNTGAANDIVYWTTNASTWGDLVNITAGNFAIKAQTGDITITASNNVGNFNMPNTVVSGNAGIITWGGTGSAFRWIHNFGLNNVFVGLQAGNTTLTTVSAFSNTGIGEDSLQSLTTGHDNTAVGNQSLASNTTSFACTAIGNGSLFSVTAGANANTCLGNQTMFSATSGTDNTALGSAALKFLLTGSLNITIGSQSGLNYVGAESSNILIGSQGVVGESNTIRIGGSLGTAASQQNKTFITACYSNFGTNNTFVGSGSGNITLTVGSAVSNTSLGNASMISLTTGAGNVGLGAGSSDAITTGSTNTGLGVSSLGNLITGSFNVALGQNAGLNYTGAESSNIMIGNSGTVGESNTTRIGGATGTAAGEQNRCFITGIRGITTGVNDAIAVLIDSAGQLGTVSSSMRYKDNIQDMFHHSTDIYNLRPVIFTYKGKSKISYGLIAEEVEDVMPNLVVYNDKKEPETVKYLDLIPMLLNEIQKLNARVDYLEKGMKHVKFSL